MNEFRICDKCKGFDCNEFITKLKEIDESAKIVIGCQSMCAIGSKKPFVIVNGSPDFIFSMNNGITDPREHITLP